MRKIIQSIIFDVDSTLCTIEGIDELARMKGVEEQIIPLTQRAMEGQLSLEEIFARRLALIQPTTIDLAKLASLYCQSLSPSIPGVLNELRKRKIDCYIVSGGYKEAVLPLADFLRIPSQNVYANSLYFDEKGIYRGFDQNCPLWKRNGKTEVIKKLPLKRKSILVGDGMSDAEAKEAVDIFIGYGGVTKREKVKQLSNYYIFDMRGVFEVIDEF